MPARSEIGVIAFYLAILAAAAVALLAEDLVAFIALVVLGILVLYLVVGDFFLALSDERASKRYPDDNCNSDVGSNVKVLDDFVLASGKGKGKVLMSGETWQARSIDGELYQRGTELVVVSIEGLVLVVAPTEKAALERTAGALGNGR